MALVNCPECGKEISDQASACPGCGKPMAGAIGSGYEYRSAAQIWGWPLVHVTSGIDPTTRRKRVAKGIIAIGDVAIGGVAIGGMAVGGVAIGGGALGLIALGGGAIGVLLALGGVAVGGLAYGGLAIGAVAAGGGAIGYYACGGGAWGVHPLCPGNEDPEALAFFRRWLPWMAEPFLRGPG
jgi:hypothetical protein